MDDTSTIVAAFEERAKRLGLPMYQVLKHAKIAPSTFTRWKAETFEPTSRALRRLSSALAELEASKAATSPAAE